MAIQAACPNCNKEFNLVPRLAGKKVRCPACSEVFRAPEETVANGVAPEVAPPATPPAAPPVAPPAPPVASAPVPAADEGLLVTELAEGEEAVQAAPPPARRSVTAATKGSAPVLELADEGAPPPKKSKALLFLLLGGGLAAFLLLGCVVSGVAALFLLPSRVAVNTQPGFNPGPGPVPIGPGPVPGAPTQPTPPPPTRPNPVPPNSKAPPPPPSRPARGPGPAPGPDVDADPMPVPLKAAEKPGGTIPMPASASMSIPVFYPWLPGPIAVVRADQKGESDWEVWNLQSMKKLGAVKHSSGFVTVSPDGAYVALPARDQPGSIQLSGIQVYTVAEGKPLRKFPASDFKFVGSGVGDFAGPGQFLSWQSKGQTGEVKLWDIKTGETVSTFKTAGMVSRTLCALSPGGRYMAVFDSLDNKHPINVYELKTGKVVRTIPTRLPTVGYANCVALAFSHDGKEVALLVNCDDKAEYVMAWNFENGKQTVEHKFDTPLAKKAESGPAYYPVALEWLPDRSGWLAYGQLMIDRNTGKVFWTLPQKEKAQWERRFVDSDHVATIVPKSGRERVLEIIALPKEEIAAARKK